VAKRDTTDTVFRERNGIQIRAVFRGECSLPRTATGARRKKAISKGPSRGQDNGRQCPCVPDRTPKPLPCLNRPPACRCDDRGCVSDPPFVLRRSQNLSRAPVLRIAGIRAVLPANDLQLTVGDFDRDSSSKLLEDGTSKHCVAVKRTITWRWHAGAS
jgi:hypothetical protein